MEFSFFVTLLLFALYSSTLFSVSLCTPVCGNITCPKPLECHPPNSPVILPDPENECCNITECICEGTDSRMSQVGDLPNHYQRFVSRFTNCTLVEGNLEITHITGIENGVEKYFSLDVTKHIRAVTGFVLISGNDIRHIDLSSLRLIRGKKLYEANRGTLKSCQYVEPDERVGFALYITANQHGNKDIGLISIDLRHLTEISRGQVEVTRNSHLCYFDTIKWEDEILGSPLHQNANIQLTSKKCSNCSKSCISAGSDDVARCWGPSNETCQQYTASVCTYCNGRCEATSKENKQCCNSDCAGGCLGTRCYFCKEQSDFGKCASVCPTGVKRDGFGNEISIDKNAVRYRLSYYCVKKCPGNLRLLEQSRSCVVACPEEHYHVNGICKPCLKGECDHICYGLDLALGDLKENDVINSGNIGKFSKKCTVIKGSLNFRQSTFEGDNICNISKMSEKMLDVFENVEVITGYLSIEYWPRRDLCVFKNLKKIEGLSKRFRNRYSLIVMTDDERLRELCFNSLEEISSGSVAVVRNKHLCHANEVNWNVTFQSPEQSVLRARKPEPGSCRPCDSNCNQSDGCWGKAKDQCVTCRNFTDYTDEFGKFASKNTLDKESGMIVPGHNVTKCVKKCNFTKGVYATEDMKCYPCHEQCNLTCSGPSPSNCTSISSAFPHGCKNVYLNGACQEKCPITHYRNGTGFCQKCSSGCLDGPCKGPENIYGDDGCSTCYKEYKPDLDLYIYHGVTCSVCQRELKDEKCAAGCKYQNSTGIYECYDVQRKDNVIWIAPVAVIILILLVVIGVIWFKCKNTIKTMREHIGQKLVDDPMVVDEFDNPTSPSGTAPNTAHLRLVKESDFTLGKELGSGAFGAVYKAVWSYVWQGHPVKIPVAVKQLKTFANSNEILEEAHVMATVKNPYLVRLLGICVSEKISLITQLMPLGSLLDYVRSDTTEIGSRHMLTWCMQIAKGMQYLEENHMVHRDLAARNVLVKTPHHVKITDFGLSKMLNETQSVYFAEGGKLPIKWLAIECITERRFSHQSDVWSFGVTCWEIFTFGTRPYDGVRAVDVLSLLERGERLMQPPVCTIDVYMLLVKCWLVDPDERPQFRELVDKFKMMSDDFSRYLVIKDDSTANLLSPDPEDEKRFFEQLIREEDMGIDEELALEDPDTYLLRHEINNLPEYENQPRVPRHRNNGSVGGPPRELRLFSRNTPSAQLPTPQSQNPSNSFVRSSSCVRESDSSNPDDVFMNSGHGLHNKKAPLVVDMTIPEKPLHPQVRFNDPTGNSVWYGQGRKDSEESSRYTEDPTTHNRNSYIDETISSTVNRDIQPSEHADGMFYDEEEYLLPTPSRKNDYFTSKNETQPKLPEEIPADVGLSLSNNVYMDSNEMTQSRQTHPSTWTNQFLSRDNTREEQLYVNNEVPEHEYRNCNGQDADERTPMNPDAGYVSSTDFAKSAGSQDRTNVDYLNPSNIVHDIDDSAGSIDLSNYNSSPTKPQAQNHRSSPILTDSNGRIGFKQNGRVHTNETGELEPEFAPSLAQGNQNSVHGTPTNVITGLDNPEYMMLQGSNTESTALLSEDTSEA